MTPAFFINPHSERVGKRGSRLSGHAAEFGASVFDLALFESLPSQVEHALAHHDTLVIEGGDGTVQCVMSEVLRQCGEDRPLPDFAIALGGMTNQVAKVIGMRRVGRSGLKRLQDADDVLETRLLRISAADSPEQYGFLFSTGALPMVTEYAKNELHTRGIGGQAAVVGGLVKALTSDRDTVMPATECRLSVDDSVLDGAHLGTVATTLPTITMGLDPFWGKGDRPLRLTYIDGDYQRLFGHVASVWVGFKDRDRTPDGFHSFNADAANFSYAGPVMLDGEPIALPGPEFQLSTSRPVRILR